MRSGVLVPSKRFGTGPGAARPRMSLICPTAALWMNQKPLLTPCPGHGGAESAPRGPAQPTRPSFSAALSHMLKEARSPKSARAGSRAPTGSSAVDSVLRRWFPEHLGSDLGRRGSHGHDGAFFVKEFPGEKARVSAASDHSPSS